MNYKFILFERENGVGKITLNRPDVLNSFHKPMAKETQDALRICTQDDGIRAVLLTGSGSAFCAGQDLEEAVPPEGPPADIREILEVTYHPIILALRTIEKPVICAVNGVAAGAGASIACACDLVLASEKASFMQAFCHIGLIPDSSSTFFLPRLIGLPRAAAMMLLGEKIGAEKAEQMGMIYKVLPADALTGEATKLATRMASGPTRGYGLIKRALNQSLSNDLESQLAVEMELQGKAGASEDYREGVAAFLEKRRPEFKGK